MNEPARAPDLPLLVLLFATIAGFVAIARSFIGTLLVAAMIVVVVWPLHAAVLRVVRRRLVAAILSSLVLAFAIVGTLSLAVGVVLPEIGRLSSELSQAAQAGALSTSLERFDLSIANAWVERLTGKPTDLVAEVVSALQSVLGDLAGAVAGAIPTLLQVTGLAILQLLIFLIALGTFLLSGPELVAWIRRLAPLAPAYSDKLMAIFASFSRNVVAASLAGAVSQGAVSGLGYLIVGVERAAFFAVLSAVAAVVPMVGPMLVWVPVSILLFAQDRTGAGIFVIVWNIALTGTVDNLVKPLVVRGRSDLPPLLIFLGVFGGLTTLGLIGLLVGPMMVAMMMTLFTIYEERLAPSSVEPARPPPSGAPTG